MSKATAELDFFGVEKEISPPSFCKSQFQKLLQPQGSFRGVQGGVSKIDPNILKNLMASGTASSEGKQTELRFDSRSTPSGNQSLIPTLPVLNSAVRSTTEIPPQSARLTIFYNGTVSVFDVPAEKAEKIIKLAETELTNPKLVASSSAEPRLLENLNGDLPIARKKSLRRFLEKRKERLTSVTPYQSVDTCGSEGVGEDKKDN